MTTTTNTHGGLIERVRSFITEYTALPGEHYNDILSLYVFHTHAFDAARTTPYIYLTSKGPGSGKTRVMEVLHEIVRSPNMQAGLTGPTFFRLIEARRPTFFMDEVDTIYSGSKNEELRGVLNSGYKHNGSIARVDNSSEDGFRDYSTFCPKVLAGIDNGSVPDTVLDRAIKIELVKAAPGTVQPFYSDDVEDIAADMVDDLRNWAKANYDALRDRANRPDPLPELSDRQNDIARPLLTIADRIGGEWPERARAAFIAALATQETPLTPNVKALIAAREWFDANPDADRVPSAALLTALNVNGKRLGVLFAPYEISPTTARIDGKPTKCYYRESFEAAWQRFL